MNFLTTAATFLFITSLTAASDLQPHHAHRQQPDAIRVITLNLAHGRADSPHQVGLPRAQYEENIDRAAALIRDHGADVVALQEADGASAWSGRFDHVQRFVEKAELPHLFHGLHFEVGIGDLRVAYGTAIASRTALGNTESKRFRGDPVHAKGFVMADVELAGKGVTIVSLHLHSGNREIRRNQAAQIIEALRERRESLIVAGDFNCGWLDEGDALRRITTALDLEAFEPERRDLDTFRSANPLTRLDWILISRDLEFVSYRVLPDRVSDHLAVEADISCQQSDK
jgi:endonuclease/exonuclease/phosphatase family metal-dependent hydrolase